MYFFYRFINFTSYVINNTFASISLNFVGDNNDSTIITFLSLGATRAYLNNVSRHIYIKTLLIYIHISNI